MASPTFQAHGSLNTTSTLSPAATCPVTTTTNRLLIWNFIGGTNYTGVTPPTGFTARINAAVGSARICVATKTGVVGDSGTVFTGSATGTTGSSGKWIDVYDNYDTTFAGTWASSTANGTMSTTALAMASVTTNVADATLYGVFWSGSGGTFTPDANMTERMDTGTGLGVAEVADEARPTAGAIGTRTATAGTATSTWSAVGLQLPGTGAATTTLTQTTFRGRNDDGSETTASWKATAGTDWTQDVDTNFRVRFNVNASTAAPTLNTPFVLRYSLNGGTYTAVSAASTVVRASASPNVTDGAATTEQLAGTGTFNAGTIDEVDGSALGFTGAVATGQDTEVEYSAQIRSADVVNNDTVNLRVYNGTTALNTYTDTPIITVNEVTAAASLVFPPQDMRLQHLRNR